MSAKKGISSLPIILGIIAALLAGQIANSYNFGISLSTLVTVVIAVTLWYTINFFRKRKQDETNY